MSLKKGYGVENTLHETLKYAINVNKNILKMKKIFLAQNIPIGSSNGSRHSDTT